MFGFTTEWLDVNTNQQEIEKFNEHAHYWWDPQGPLHTLHEINPLRLAFIQAHCVLSTRSVLDVGCGGGILSESLAQAGAQVTGIDLAYDLIQMAQLHQLEQNLNIHYLCQPIESLTENNANAFDVITCMEMLEHVPEPESIVGACANLLKPGGILFFSTLNRNLKSFLYAIVGAEYLLKLLPQGTHDYDKFITPAELARCAREHGLRLIAQEGIGYQPISKKYYRSHDVSVNYMACFIKD